jgi:heptosyltransferase-3
MTHTVVQKRLADVLGIPRCYEVVPPVRPDAGQLLDRVLPFSWRNEPYLEGDRQGRGACGS